MEEPVTTSTGKPPAEKMVGDKCFSASETVPRVGVHCPVSNTSGLRPENPCCPRRSYHVREGGRRGYEDSAMPERSRYPSRRYLSVGPRGMQLGNPYDPYGESPRHGGIVLYFVAEREVVWYDKDEYLAFGGS